MAVSPRVADYPISECHRTASHESPACGSGCAVSSGDPGGEPPEDVTDTVGVKQTFDELSFCEGGGHFPLEEAESVFRAEDGVDAKPDRDEGKGLGSKLQTGMLRQCHDYLEGIGNLKRLSRSEVRA